MSSSRDVTDEVTEAAESRPMRLAARAGLAVNGMLHLLVAWLAVRLASGTRERADQAGALQSIAAEPFGRVLLWLVVFGFAAVVVWRLREALSGFRYVRDRKQRTQKRLFSALQVTVFSVLTVLTIRVASGSPAGNGGQGLTATLLRMPAGRWLVVAIGVGVFVSGAVMIYRGWHLAFTEDMDLGRASARTRKIVERTGLVGSMAKGVAVMIVGVLIATAAMTSRPEKAEGLDAALKAVAAQPFGSALLIAVAAGFASFGVYCFFDARYHRV
jgi:hypothetical protein